PAVDDGWIVDGLEESVEAVDRNPAVARPTAAHVGRGAGVAVAAGRGVVGVRAAGRGIAAVVGTDVAVVAVRRRAPDTRATGTGVVGRTRAAVVAGLGIVRVHAAASRVAAIVRADIGVVAVRRRAPDTRATGTGVVGRTRAAVVAGLGIVRVHAAASRVAAVVGADIGVVAVRRGTADACATGTGVVGRTRAAVIAGLGIVRVHAAASRVAAIVRADIGVVAVRRGTADACATGTRVVGRTRAAVVARRGVVRVLT